MDLDQAFVVQDVPDKGCGEKRLDAAGTAGDQADGARGSDRGRGRVPPGGESPFPINALLKIGKCASSLCQFLRGTHRLPGNEFHQTLGHLDRLLGVVRDSESDQQVRKTHHPQTDLPVRPGHPFDLLQGIAVHVDHIVQEMDGQLHVFRESLPIDPSVVVHHPGQIQ